MLAVFIDLKDDATPVVRALGRAVEPARLKPIVGRAGVNCYRAHLFEANASRPNLLGGTRTNYYAGAARSTHFDVLADGVLISVNQIGLRLHVLGGTVKPVVKKFLTIPARSEAHGKRAGEFNGLFIVFGKSGRPIALARAAQSLIGFRRDGNRSVVGVSRRGSAGGEILFWLVDSVTVRPDPSLVPDDVKLYAAISTAVDAYLQLQMDRTQGRN